MAERHSIRPFPADIDRDAFGHWVSGFTDGEGCFNLNLRRGRGTCPLRFPRARFFLALRIDDRAILELVQAYWGCGTISDKEGSQPTADRRTNPQSRLTVELVPDVVRAVIPHFDRYPLRAKKARDYVIWRQGAVLCGKVAQRRQHGRRGIGGKMCKWTLPERREFEALKAALEQVRAFDAPEVAPVEPIDPPADPQLRLFD